MLTRGQRMLAADLIEDAGRAAYLAAFHAAQAFIYERQRRTLKTHGGMRSEFAKLIRDDTSVRLICAALCPVPMRSKRSPTTTR